MEAVEIPTDRLIPNPWNVNSMSTKMREKLARHIKREGLVELLVVRPHPDREGHYQILGGEHRWRICKEEE